jgi:four helix bundle protein
VTGYKTYRELNTWIKPRALVKEVYGLTSQIRRCAVSVPSNIAEGYGRQFRKESVQFFHIAGGSLYERETQLYIAFGLEYITTERLDSIILQVEECRKLLNGLINYFEKSETLK